jgi:AcrR family transcriptional regulator
MNATPVAPPMSRAEQRTNTLRRIIAAARAVLEQEGPRGFSARAIATRAGISQGRLLQYFKSLDDVAFEAYTHWVEEEFELRTRAAMQADGPQARLAALTKVGYERDLTGVQMMRQVSRYAWFWPRETQTRFQSNNDKVIAFIVALLGEAAPNAKAPALHAGAAAVISIYIAVLRSATVEEWAPEQAHRKAMSMIDLVIAGLRAG